MPSGKRETERKGNAPAGQIAMDAPIIRFANVDDSIRIADVYRQTSNRETRIGQKLMTWRLKIAVRKKEAQLVPRKDAASVAVANDSKSVVEALSCHESNEWLEAIKRESEALHAMDCVSVETHEHTCDSLTLTAAEIRRLKILHMLCFQIWKCRHQLGIKEAKTLYTVQYGGRVRGIVGSIVDESELKLARNPVFHARMEDIDIRYHFIREAAERKYVELRYLPTEQMVADILTKGLFKPNHEKRFLVMVEDRRNAILLCVNRSLQSILPKKKKLRKESVLGSSESENMASGETLAERYKREDKEISKAFWEVLDINSRGTILLRFKYYVWRMLDIPATWMKENVVDPLQKDRKMPYYHQRFNRVRTIDECAVDDRVCYEEAQMQYHLDKMVDGYILDILRNRMQRCREYYMNNAEYKCAKCIDDFEQAELNFYIKYGDMGYYGDVLTAYTKQKHRMIWERRHPEIMAARAEAREEHKRQMELGNYDPSFWKRKDPRLYKDYLISIFTPYNYSSFLRFKRDEPSQDPKFYKEREEARQKGEYKEPANPNLIWP
ncbi:NADH dehydrogenase [ubiquinone] 1 beta subcomplex subunit 10 [Trichinella nelsoni]|uniref:NADH dehydrogenase [ubiquinone] 1 beta subcomplex subunit 10 n=1 Tax=Trichinella nelsoni TaxID=6336 RepID=A0A0V0SJ90_9BILA|nr:NADH dehydrogenase [ubiquinone] 1 beta subcomplex subunit 10 [Trichinella nelsoni]